MADSELRQRKPVPQEHEGERLEDSPKKAKKTTPSKADDDYSPWMDVLRVLSFLFVVSCVSSYVLSSGESFFWGMKEKPPYMKVNYWKEKIQGPVRTIQSHFLY